MSKIQFHLDDDLKAIWQSLQTQIDQSRQVKSPIILQAELERLQIMRDTQMLLEIGQQVLAKIGTQGSDQTKIDQILASVQAKTQTLKTALASVNNPPTP